MNGKPGRPAGGTEGELRDRLLLAGAQEFADRGFSGAKVNDIVRAAGTTKPMLYYYFTDKAGLYRVCVEEAYTRVRQKTESIPTSGSVEDRLIAIVQANLDLYRQSPELARFAIAATVSSHKDAPDVPTVELGDANFAVVVGIVEEAIEKGEVTASAWSVAVALSGVILAFLIGQLTRPDQPVLEEDGVRMMVRLLLEGARPRQEGSR